MNPDLILAQLAPSPARKTFAAAVLYGLAGFLFLLSVMAPGAMLARVVLLLCALLSLYVAERQRKTWTQRLILTAEGLVVDDGTEIAKLSEIASVDRGAFAFKPSNGFLLRLKTRHARAWHPGLWWRSGKRVGVGGITSAAEGKFMAERIALLITNPTLFDDEDPTD